LPSERRSFRKGEGHEEEILRIDAERSFGEGEEGTHGGTGAGQQEHGKGNLTGDEGAMGVAAAQASGHARAVGLGERGGLGTESCQAGDRPKRIPVSSAMPTAKRRTVALTWMAALASCGKEYIGRFVVMRSTPR